MLKRIATVRKDEHDQAKAILEAIGLGDDVTVLYEGIDDALLAAAQAGGLDALAQIGVEDSKAIVDLVNEAGVAYARDRAAEMVGKRWVDGELVDNPNAEWVIDEATREMLRSAVEDALEEGASNEELANEISGSYAFSEERASVIARTETATADVQGNLEAYRQSGEVASKRWLTAPDCCDECAELDGEEVPLDDEFPNDGGDGPPLHPNCRCDVVPVLTTESDSEE